MLAIRREPIKQILRRAAGLGTAVALWARCRTFRRSTTCRFFAARFGATFVFFDEYIFGVDLRKVILECIGNGAFLRVDHPDLIIEPALHLLELDLLLVGEWVADLKLLLVLWRGGVSVVKLDSVNASGWS